eukprot:5218386-Prymnesium_polylepis.1
MTSSRPVSLADRKIRCLTAETRATRGIYIYYTHPHCTYAKDDTRSRDKHGKKSQDKRLRPSAQLELAHR